MSVEWDPSSYAEAIRAEVPLYERLQQEAVRASARGQVEAILELGVGTGETARRILAAHPPARLTAVDSSASMLARACEELGGRNVELRLQRLEDPLPAGPFDLVVSVLAVHHLDAARKRDLFSRVARVLRPGGRFVLGDLVVPRRPEDAITPVDGDYDRPSTVEEQLGWLRAAELDAQVAWEQRDLAVLVAVRPVGGSASAGEKPGTRTRSLRP